MFAYISGFFGFFQLAGVTTDDWVFQLHYRFTTVLLFFISVVITMAKIFSDVINCMTYDGKIPAPVLNSYGWLVANCTSTRVDGSQGGKCYWAPLYYVWTPFILLTFGILFYAPKYLWMYLEENTVERLCKTAKSTVVEGGSKEKLKKTLEEMADYFQQHEGHHEPFAYYYTLCQVLNFINVSVQFILINLFPCIACKKMCNFWQEMLEYKREPFPVVMHCGMDRAFFDPAKLNVTKYRYAICVVPLNDLHNQIAYLLWTWFCLVLVLSALALMWSALQLGNNSVKKCWFKFKVIQRETMEGWIDDLVTGDVHRWFLLTTVKRNLTRTQFKLFLQCYNQKANTNVQTENGFEMATNTAGASHGTEAMNRTTSNDRNNTEVGNLQETASLLRLHTSGM